MKKMWLMSLAVGLVVLVSGGVAALVASEEPAEAAFPGNNGLIVFSDSYNRLFVMGPDGGGLRKLPLGEREVLNDHVLFPQWSPGGRYILFGYRPTDDVPGGDVYVAGADGTGWQAVADDPDVLEREPQWYPSGRRVTFCAAPIKEDPGYRWPDEEAYEAYSLRLDRHKRPVGSPVQLTDNNTYDCPVAVSPDGQKLVFYSMRDGEFGGGLFVMGANRREGPANPAVRLADGSDKADFSPSGEKIAYSGSGNGDYSDVFVINADGSGKTNLTHSAGVSEGSLAWSPDSEEIAYSRTRWPEDTSSGSQRWETTIWKMHSDGTGQVQLTTLKKTGFYGLDWQPIP